MRGLRPIGEPASWILALVSMVVAVGKIWNILKPSFYTSPYFVGVLVGFIGHEIAHRTIARRHGLYAEFYATPYGILLTFLTGFIPGIVILAPGYVGVTAYYVYNPRGWIRSVEAGPATNILLGLLALGASLLVKGYWSHYMSIVAMINGWIAFFNLLPIPPLDGSKIFRADMNGWIVMFILSLLLWMIPS
ncbi:MAG: site-2 protease family protein [Desulfurococcales archaeon]|nr:site-2 protease family protein [Desulfurococcales archaeon]